MLLCLAKCKFVRKNEDKSYVTYLVAAPGFQCIARDKYSKDLSPSETHAQLQVYVHVMDALAGSVDQSLVSESVQIMSESILAEPQ